MEIKSLTLFSSQLLELKKFYTDILRLTLVTQQSDHFSIDLGTTRLTFKKSDSECYYHFAINIPSFQIEEAYDWIKKKTKVLPFMGNEIVDFSSWNAKALYFYDPSGNIVEFIARKNLDIHSSLPFSSESFHHISEIGLPVTQVAETYDFLHQECGLEKYSGDFERFCAIGEETGLFITIDYQQKDWIPNNDKAEPFPFEISFNHNQNPFELVYRDEKLALT